MQSKAIILDQVTRSRRRIEEKNDSYRQRWNDIPHHSFPREKSSSSRERRQDAHPRHVCSLRIEPIECPECNQKRSYWTK
mmetsp:Transcript_3389/g.11476  ORF Transcript_3389/g.11476 Transcript_3389/m.11476 type:complete len:80 (-) Transcript_3389:105-344(-)